MGLTGGVIKWLIDRNQSRLKEMSKDSLEIDFQLRYGYLEGLCSKKQLEGIKKIYQELEELKTSLGQVYEITPAPLEKIERRNELELFFNDIDRIINQGKLDVAIMAIELDTQQKINEAIKRMVMAREDFIQTCPDYLSMNIEYGQNVYILNEARNKINCAYYESLDIYKNSPDFPIINNKLNEIRDKMFLCEKHMYNYREKGFDFSEDKKTELYELEAEFSNFGSERLAGLKTIDEGFHEIRRKMAEEALKKREEQREFDKFAERVDEVYEQTKELAEASIPIRSSHVSINERMSR
ncbi:MAG: hypothetical protein GX092_04090 [Clostridia bacterium]|nr:hypothetical protein [Clostridia bacterium]